MGSRCRALSRCHLLVLAALLLHFSLLDAPLTLPLLRSSRELRVESPGSLGTCPAPASGPLAELLELPRLAPLLWPGIESGMQGSAHEREGDFSSWLYAEGDRLYFFDQAGPLCLTRSFYGASGELADDPALRFFEDAVLGIEVDGVEVLAAPAEDFFNGALEALFPAGLTSSLPDVFSRGGNVLLTPLCAHERLRLSFAFPLSSDPRVSRAVSGLEVNTSAQAMAQADACVAADLKCYLKVYTDTSFLRFPMPKLPEGWAAFDGRTPAALPAASPGPGGHFGAAQHLARLEAAADAQLTQSSCSVLSPSAAAHTLFAAQGSGTVLSMRIDFEDAAHAHSSRLLLTAEWDGPSGGRLHTSLQSLFGPATLGYGSDQIPTRPSQQLAFGTLQSGGSGEGRSVYLALPAPYWISANVTLELLLDEGKAESIALCSKVLATPALPSAAAPALRRGGGCASAYLQGSFYDFFVARTRENELLALQGHAGKLVAVTSFLEARRGVYTTSVVEGDMRVTVDGGASPAAWDSGYEDFFNGAHTYQWGVNRTWEPLFAHQRRDTERWMMHASSQCIEAGGGQSCGVWRSKLHPDTDLLSTRVLLLDAIPFHHSIALAFEGFSGDYEMAQVRGAVLWYGVRSPAPPALTDTVYPAVEVFKPRSAQLHGYSVREEGAALPLLRYDLTSAFSGAGEPPDAEDGSCPIRSTGHGAAGADYLSCPAPLLTMPVLALHPGARVAFTLALDPAASHCALRRVLDVAYSVQMALLHVDGVRVATLASSDRAFTHLNTRWRERSTHLDPALTRGKARIHVQLTVLGDSAGGARGRVYPAAQQGEAWTEARWQAVCFYD